MGQKLDLSSYFNIKSVQKIFCAGLLTITASFSTASANNIDDVDTNNKADITEFIKSDVLAFWNSYEFKQPQSLQQYQKCRPSKKLKVSFKLNVKPTLYDKTSKSIAEMTAYTDKQKRTGHKKRDTLGYTSWISTIDIKFNPILKVTNNKICLSINKVEVVYNTKQSVYIASDFKDNSCYSNRIKKHENEHVFFNNVATRAYTSITEKFYTQVLSGFNGVYIDSTDKDAQFVYSNIRKHIGDAMKDLNKALHKTSMRLHGKIDTVESYRKINMAISKACRKP